MSEWMNLSNAEKEQVVAAALDNMMQKGYAKKKITRMRHYCVCGHGKGAHKHSTGKCFSDANCRCTLFNEINIRKPTRSEQKKRPVAVRLSNKPTTVKSGQNLPTPDEFKAIDDAMKKDKSE